jgi:hypothetical protein
MGDLDERLRYDGFVSETLIYRTFLEEVILATCIHPPLNSKAACFALGGFDKKLQGTSGLWAKRDLMYACTVALFRHGEDMCL